MYQLERKDGRVVISDWDGKVVYSVPEDSYVVYQQSPSQVVAVKAKDLKDGALLMALATAVKLPFTA